MLLNKFHTTVKTRVVDKWTPYSMPGVLGFHTNPNETSYIMHTKIHPVELYIIIDGITDILDLRNVIHMMYLDPSHLDISYLEFFMELERLRWVESSLYFYFELLKGGRLCFHMRFPFVNRRDWMDIIAETFQMDYKRIHLNTGNPDKNIELWTITTEFYLFKSLPPDREDIILQLKPHGMKTFDNTNIVITITSMYEFPTTLKSLDIHKEVELFWKGYMQLSNQNLIHVISLQGEYKEVSMQNMEQNTNGTLNFH